jgi:hypothetical protein
MAIVVLAVMKNVYTTVQNVITLKIQKTALRVMMDIILVLLETAHHNVYLDVKHARQVPRVHHARRDIIMTMVTKTVAIVTVLKVVIVKIISVCHVRTVITIPVLIVIAYVQVTVSIVQLILIVDRVRMGILKVTRITT